MFRRWRSLLLVHGGKFLERQATAPGIGGSTGPLSLAGNVRELEHALKHAVAMCDGGEIEADDFPHSVRVALYDQISPQALPHLAGTTDQPPINIAALRQAIRAAPALRSGAERTSQTPAHVDYAKRIWLGTLIDELNGDLALIGLFWDRSSEKTLRGLIRDYGLAEHLDAARARRRN